MKKKFKVVLVDCPKYPTFVYAENVNEAKAMMMESLAHESSIMSIIEEGTEQPKNTSQYYGAATEDEDANVMFEHLLKNTNEQVNVGMNKIASNAMASDFNSEINVETSISFPNDNGGTSVPINVANAQPVIIAEDLSIQDAHKNILCTEDVEELPTEHIEAVKYFEEAGMKFKLENGKLFKKVFEKVDDPEEYRILNKAGKKVSLNNYVIEHLTWKEI